MAQGIGFSILGPVRAWSGGTELDMGQPKQRAILASLLLRDGGQATISELVADVWGEEAPSSAVGSIRTYIFRLRKVAKESGLFRIQSTSGGYSLVTAPETIDLNMFKRCVYLAREARRNGDHAKSASFFAEGLALWAGPPLAGIPGPRAEAQRHLLGELRLTALEERLASDIERGLYAESVAELSALVAEHPLRERLCELLMIALYGAGRPSEALNAFHEVGHLLRKELGISPSASLQAVQQRILSDDLPLAREAQTVVDPPVAAAVVPAQLPAQLRHFVRRDDCDRQMSRLLDGALSAPAMLTCAVVGMAGVGKSALAVRWAHQVAPRFPDGQLFADLRGFDPNRDPLDPAGVLGEFLRTLGVGAADVPEGVAARSALFRSLLAGRRVLVLLDNARDAQQVRPLLPGTEGCLALVTSRRQMWGLVTSHQAHLIPLGPLDEAESRELLVHLLGRRRVEAEPTAADEIVSRCGRLPLALAVAAARGRAGFPLSAIAMKLRMGRGTLDAFTGTGDPELDVREILLGSYRVLTPQAAELFRSLAPHPGPQLTAQSAAALAGLPLRQVSGLLTELSQVHLLTEHADGRYSWHELVRAYATGLLQSRDGAVESGPAVNRLADHFRSGPDPVRSAV
ncbi:BTAD domain-containing putative transcriptional regulator [Streptomyces sp. NPDC059928]|uniref:AfsR/SARP family transcriptional regulator n=1 Tax=unclassified Streptomyces TaxID=2593676 RepID=UPI0036573FC0